MIIIAINSKPHHIELRDLEPQGHHTKEWLFYRDQLRLKGKTNCAMNVHHDSVNGKRKVNDKFLHSFKQSFTRLATQFLRRGNSISWTAFSRRTLKDTSGLYVIKYF